MMLPYTELGTFSFSYRTLGIHGMGISASSNFAVLYEASQQYLRNGPPLCLEEVAAAALRFERQLARGQLDRDLAVAADDVYPITHGGVLKVLTAPSIQDSNMGVSVEPIRHDTRWLADRIVVAFNPQGKRHVIPDLLDRLLNLPNAGEHIKKFTDLAHVASSAIAESYKPHSTDKGDEREIRKLADAVNRYRQEFDEWTKEAEAGAPGDGVDPPHGPLFTRAVTDIATDLLKELTKDVVLGWKPPGGGASESLIVITPDVKGRDAVIRFFKSEKWKWRALPAYVTSGICGEFVKSDGEVRITAGHRLDFIGAADLGQDVRIRKAGCCCSCAIEPRTEIVLSST